MLVPRARTHNEKRISLSSRFFFCFCRLLFLFALILKQFSVWHSRRITLENINIHTNTESEWEWVRWRDQVNSASSMVIVKLYRALVSIYLFIFIASIYSSQAFSKDTLQILQRIESKQIEKYKRSIQIIQQIHFRTDCSSAGVYTFFMWLPHLFVHWCYAIGAFFSVYIHLKVVDKR